MNKLESLDLFRIARHAVVKSGAAGDRDELAADALEVAWTHSACRVWIREAIALEERGDDANPFVPRIIGFLARAAYYLSMQGNSLRCDGDSEAIDQSPDRSCDDELPERIWLAVRAENYRKGDEAVAAADRRCLELLAQTGDRLIVSRILGESRQQVAARCERIGRQLVAAKAV